MRGREAGSEGGGAVKEQRLGGTYLMVVAAMCGLSMATVGFITNIAGLFFTPMAEEFGVLRGAASLTLTIANICVAIGGLATRRMTKLLSWRALLLAGTTVLAGSTLAGALAPSIGLAYLFSATKGLAGGVIGFVLITYVLNKWFVARLGLVTSVAMGCSVSNAVFSSGVGYAYDLTGSYVTSLVAFLAFLAGSVALALWCYRRAVRGTGLAA